jgi:hypothetical protein
LIAQSRAIAALSVVMVAGAVLGGVSACTPAPAKTLTCPDVPGLPNTENASYQIRETGTTCTVADNLGRLALTTYHGRAFSVSGWRCKSVYDPSGYPKYSYLCTQSAKRVTFYYAR